MIYHYHMKRVICLALVSLLLAMPLRAGSSSSEIINARSLSDYFDIHAADLPWYGSSRHTANQAAFERILRQYEAVGASVALIQNGVIVDVYNYGRANRGDGIPVTDETLFRVASVTKMVTMMGLMKLWELGRFNLDDTLEKHYGFSIRNPYYKDEPITIRQVMTHTASLLDGGHYYRALNGDIVNLKSVFTGKLTTTDFQRRRPGTFYDYSNFGGSLLGSMIELFSGKTADVWMHEALYDDMGITASYFTPNLPEGTPIARIYNGPDMTLDSMSLTNRDDECDPLLHYTTTAGSLSIRSIDLAKLLIVLMGDGTYNGARILSNAAVEMIRTPQNNMGSVEIETGRGLDMNIYTDALVKGRTLYGHQGKAYGAISAAYFDPADRTGVVLLTNGCDDSTFNSVARIARAVVAAGYGMLE
jgi:CubicO group peptidase (beta-lactamase class C family)